MTSENRPVRRRLSIRLLPDAHEKLTVLADQMGISASRLVEIAVSHTVEALNEMVHHRLLREARREKALAKIESGAQKRTRFSRADPPSTVFPLTGAGQS